MDNRCIICESSISDQETYCSFCKKIAMATQAIRKQKKKPKIKTKDNRKYIQIQCIKCKRIDKIQTNNLDYYNDYLNGKKKWICILCRESKSKNQWKI